jgi:hypothetical protein
VSIETGLDVMVGETVNVPIRIAGGSGIRSFAVTVHFDPDVLALEHAALSRPGTLTPTTLVPGQLSLVGLFDRPMNAGGSLLTMSFTAIGECSASSVLEVTSCLLDNGAIGCLASDGDVTVHCGVGGRIKHWRTRAPVGGVTVALMGDTGTATAVTDDLGEFSFGELDPGTWQMQPQKRGDAVGAISALDGALVLRTVAGLAQMDDVQRLACDVTGNGQLSALDASRILQLAVGQVVALPIAGICGSDWAFVPAPTAMPYQRLVLPEPGVNTCQPGSIVLDPLLGDAPRQDFSAVLFGDCTGNWNAPLTARAQLSLSRDGRVRLGSPQRRGSGRWAIPLLVDSPEPYLSVEVRISYDGERARPIQVRAAGTARDALLRYDSDDHGVLAVALASVTPLTAEGPVATLLFESASRRSDGHIAQLVAAAIDEVAVAVP